MKTHTPPRSVLAGLAIVGLLAISGVALAQEGDPAIVTVFHAVPAEDGFPADVYLNGDLIIDGFVFASRSDGFELAAGSAELEVFPEGSDPGADEPAVTATVTLEAGANYSVVAQIADGAPVVSVFENDLSGVGPGEARLIFRQTSAASSLDLSIDDDLVFTEIATTNEASTNLTAGSVRLGVLDENGELVSERDIEIESGTLTVIYAAGDPAAGSFDLLVQEVVIPQVAPTEVPSGTGGDKSEVVPAAVWFLIVVGIGVAGLVVKRRTE